MSRGLARRGEGFTLLEVLVAVAVLAVALVSLLGLHARSVRLAAATRDLTIATTLAAQLAAALQTTPPPEVGSTEGTFSLEREEPASRDRPYGGPQASGFAWKQTVEPTGLANLRRVRIAVGRQGDPPLAVLEFLVRNQGSSGP